MNSKGVLCRLFNLKRNWHFISGSILRGRSIRIYTSLSGSLEPQAGIHL